MGSEPRYSAAPRYDASVLREMAARLEAGASVTVIIWTVLGVILGAGFGAVVGMAVVGPGLGALLGAVVGGVVGYLVGEHRALEIRFTAQLALCQVAIEENTRPGHADGPLMRRTEQVRPPGAATSAVAVGSTVITSETPTDTPAAEPAALGTPPGTWRELAEPPAGRYAVVTASQRDLHIASASGGEVGIEPRYGGVWISASASSGKLYSQDAYRWARSDEAPGSIMLLDTAHGTIAVFRPL